MKFTKAEIVYFSALFLEIELARFAKKKKPILYNFRIKLHQRNSGDISLINSKKLDRGSLATTSRTGGTTVTMLRNNYISII